MCLIIIISFVSLFLLKFYLLKKKIGFLQILLWDFRFGLNCTPCFSFFFNLKYDKHLVVAFHILELLICNILGLEKFPGFACLQILFVLNCVSSTACGSLAYFCLFPLVELNQSL